jgi:hypothetical protein
VAQTLDACGDLPGLLAEGCTGPGLLDKRAA